MKALTIHQPWATAIAIGLKKYETRSIQYKYRGLLAIHAGKAIPNPKIISTISASIPLSHRYSWNTDFPLGAVVAIGELTDCILMTENLIEEMSDIEKLLGDWQPGRYAFKIENIRKLDEPVLAKGSQGLWNFDDEIVKDYI